MRYSVHSLHYTHGYYTYVKLQLQSAILPGYQKDILPHAFKTAFTVFNIVLIHDQLVMEQNLQAMKCSVVSTGPEKSIDRITNIH